MKKINNENNNENNNVISNNELMVTDVSTPVVATGKKPVVKSNAKVTNKKVSDILSFDATMQLLSDCGIGCHSDSRGYRIINGGSAIHVLKTKYRIYMTPTDFTNCVDTFCKNVKPKNNQYLVDDMTFIENGNIVDTTKSNRIHTFECESTATLKKVFAVLAKNALNAPC